MSVDNAAALPASVAGARAQAASSGARARRASAS